MPLESRRRELVAIGASIGANCRPCIEHHLRAGREAGLSAADIGAAVAHARAVHTEAVSLLLARVDELLGQAGTRPAAARPTRASEADELVALGVSVAANSHALLSLHVRVALEAGLRPTEIRSALKMGQYVQQKAAEMTATRTAEILSASAAIEPATT